MKYLFFLCLTAIIAVTLVMLFAPTESIQLIMDQAVKPFCTFTVSTLEFLIFLALAIFFCIGWSKK